MLPPEHGRRDLALHFALRSDDHIEVGILGGDIVVRRAGWLARAPRESCPRWLQEVGRQRAECGEVELTRWRGHVQPMQPAS
jgi:hypothetical protein